MVKTDGPTAARKEGTFLRGAAIAVLTALFLRLAGMVFRVYLSAAVGAEGMGLYQLIFSVYSLASTVATAGLSAAVTKAVSEAAETGERHRERQVVSTALAMALFLGTAAMAALYFGASPIAMVWLRDARAEAPLRILAPGLPCMALTAVLRGYFVALRRVEVQSRSQLAEQTVRIAVVVAGLGRVRQGYVEGACRAVVTGLVLSEVAAFLYMATGYALSKKPQPGQKHRGTAGALAAVAAPVAAAGWLRSGLHTIENTLVPGRLERYGQTKAVSLSQFGALKAMALPVLMMPASFLAALSALLMPEVARKTAAGGRENAREATVLTLRLTAALSCWAAAFFWVCGPAVAQLLYKNAQVGFYIQALAPITPFIYLETMAEGLLRGLGLQTSSLRYAAADSVLRIVLVLLLVPAAGMKGFLFVMVTSNIFTSTLSLRRLCAATGARLGFWEWAGLPAVLAWVAALPGKRILAVAAAGGVGLAGQTATALSVLTVAYWGALLLCRPKDISALLALRKKTPGKKVKDC